MSRGPDLVVDNRGNLLGDIIRPPYGIMGQSGTFRRIFTLCYEIRFITESVEEPAYRHLQIAVVYTSNISTRSIDLCMVEAPNATPTLHHRIRPEHLSLSHINTATPLVVQQTPNTSLIADFDDEIRL